MKRFNWTDPSITIIPLANHSRERVPKRTNSLKSISSVNKYIYYPPFGFALSLCLFVYFMFFFILLYYEWHLTSFFLPASSQEHDTSWLVFLEGGGWCYNATHCAQKSDTSYGSSRMLNASKEFNGVLSANFTVNPDFYDWNVAVINYCDGASFSGRHTQWTIWALVCFFSLIFFLSFG